MTDVGDTRSDKSDDAYFGPVTRRGGEAREALQDKIPTISTAEDYANLKPGWNYVDPEGKTRRKAYEVKMPADYESVPEGEHYIDPEGAVRAKPKYEPVSVTAQTLYDMAVNDKERRKALERSYPGKIKQTPTGELYVDEDGVLRKPGHGMQATAGFIASSAAPVLGTVAGEVGGGVAGSVALPGPGTVGGAIGGAAAGGAAGQGFNDAVLALAGVYDRSAGEEALNVGGAALAGGAGSAAGRVVAGAYPYVKGKVTTSLPGAAAYFLGAESEGLEKAIGLSEQGVLVPPSGWAKESPHIHNIVEVFDPAFHTQKPLLQSATAHYEKKGGEILQGLGVENAGSLAHPEAAVSTEKAGAALLQKTHQEMLDADKALSDAMNQAKAERAAGAAQAELSKPTRASLEKAQDDATKAAQGLIDQGFQSIQGDIDAAMKTAKAGGNSGDLWWSVGEKLKQVKQGISARASKMYAEADELAGGLRPDTTGLSDRANAFLQQLPEGFEGKYPGIVKQLRDLAGIPEIDEHGMPTGKFVKEPVQPTWSQLHNLRSIMRQNYNSLDLTPDIKQGTFKFFANRVDEILNDANAVPELQAASRALRKADDFYRDAMGPLTDKNIQAVMTGLESGMPADPKNLYNTLIKEGRSDLTKKVRELVGPNLWAGIKAADVQDMLDMSKTLVPGQVDGRAFVKQVLDRVRSGMLEAVHGKEASEKLVRQAQHIMTLDGKLPVNVKPGDTVSEVIAKARQAADAAENAAKTDPLKTLQREMRDVDRDFQRRAAAMRRERRQDPLGFLYDPTTGASQAVDRILGSEDLVIAAARKFGENSPEFNLLRQVHAQRILQGTLEPGKRLAAISPEVQQIMFPGVTGEQMKALAEDMEFLMSSRGAKDTAKSMAAVSKVEHPWASIIGGGGSIAKLITAPVHIVPGADAVGRAMLGSYFKLIRTLFNKPALMRWVQKGLRGDEAARQMVREQLQRVTQMGGVAGAGTGEALEQTGNAPGTSPIPQ